MAQNYSHSHGNPMGIPIPMHISSPRHGEYCQVKEYSAGSVITDGRPHSGAHHSHHYSLQSTVPGTVAVTLAGSNDCYICQLTTSVAWRACLLNTSLTVALYQQSQPSLSAALCMAWRIYSPAEHPRATIHAKRNLLALFLTLTLTQGS